MKKIFQFVGKKKWFFLLVTLIFLGSGYWAYAKWGKSAPVTKYVTSTVEHGTLINSISGTGQISAAKQINISPKVSGDVLSVANISVGQEVKAGTILFQLNARDALKAVRDAQINLESAQLSLKKLQQAADPLTVLQAENSLALAEQSKQDAIDNITKGYEDAFNSIADTFLDLPTIIAGLNDILYAKEIGASEAMIGPNYWNIDALMNTVGADRYIDKLKILQNNAVTDYENARLKYNNNFANYQKTTRYSDTSTIDSLLSQTIETVKAMAQSAKSESNYLDGWVDMRTEQGFKTFSKVTSYQTALGDYISKVNSHLSSLLAIQNTLKNNRDALVNAERTIAERAQSLEDIKNGTDPLDLQAQLIAVKQRQNSLLDAQEKLADYTVRAPFDGVIAEFNVKKGDTVSAGSSVGMLVTKQQIATISLNEVDAAKVKVGQKATLIFDAVSDLTITGEVAEVDAVGTVSQGVVSYNVKVVFDVQDERIKPGMTVTANIIISSKPNVLMVKTSAIKNQDGSSYVELMVNGEIQKRIVEVGDSNDTMTEIISGLNEGDIVVVQTISSTRSSSTNSNPSGFRGGESIGPGGGNFMRLMR